MNEYIKEIEQVAAKCTLAQSDGYSQIMRICDAMREQQDTSEKATEVVGLFEEEDNNWIPVSSGIFPDDMEDVQVTFIGYNDHAPHCEAFAYRNDEKWYWSLDDGEVKVKITAWKKKCEPYKAE